MFSRAKIIGMVAGCAMLFCAALPSTVRAETCELTLRIFEFKEDGTTENFPVTDANITILKTGAKKGLKPKNVGGKLVADLEENKAYSIEIQKKGFKTTRDSVDCWPSGITAPNSQIFFIWPGEAKYIMQPSGYTGRGAIETNLVDTARSAVPRIVPTVKYDLSTAAMRLLKEISDGVVSAPATGLVQPAYPAAAKAVRASGTVNVQVTIDELGYVVSAKAVSGHPLLRAAAVKAALESRFRTTLFSGYPVKVRDVIVYNFQP